MDTRLKLLRISIVLSFISCCGQLDGNSHCPVSPHHFEEKDPPQAVIGGDVVLPCFPKFTINVKDDTLEWSKGNDEIYVIRRKSITINNSRFNASIEELEKRNASLYLSGVKQSDEGQYFCCILGSDIARKCKVVTLAVKEKGEETSTEHPGNRQIQSTEAPTDSTGSRQLDGNSHCPVSPHDFEKQAVRAVIGGDVVLPCFPNFSINVNEHILQWGKGKKDLYAIKGNIPKHVDEDYNGRLQVSIEDWKKGDASLYLSGVKPSDEGEYCCCIWIIRTPKCTNVTLAVKEKGEETSTERPDNRQIQTTEAPTNWTGSTTWKWIIGGVCVSAGLIFAVAAGLGYWRWKKRQSANDRRGQNQNAQEEDERIELKVVNDGAAEN